MRNPECSILVRQSTRVPRSLLHFKKHVSDYLRQLFYMLRSRRRKLLAYQIINDTSYLLLQGNDIRETSTFIQHLHGVVASNYSKATRKEAPFWRLNPRYTLIQSGDAIREVLAGIFLLPVDQGRALHPAGWWSSSYTETLHPKRKYRLIDRNALFEETNFEEKEFTEWLMGIAKPTMNSLHDFQEIENALGFGRETWINSQFYMGGMQKTKCQNWSDCLILFTGVRNTRSNHQDRLLRIPNP